MKIITLERKTDNGKPVEYNPVYENGEDFRDWWCKIETKEEEIVYEAFLKEKNSNIQSEAILKLWNSMVIHAGQGMGLCWGDDDVYGYIRPDETEPEVGEEYTDGDGDKWLRVE